jgi:hypothetical protein
MYLRASPPPPTTMNSRHIPEIFFRTDTYRAILFDSSEGTRIEPPRDITIFFIPPYYYPDITHIPVVKMLHCPVCNSTDVWPVTGGYIGFLYRCKRCGYRGALVVEYDREDGEVDRRHLPQ